MLWLFRISYYAPNAGLVICTTELNVSIIYFTNICECNDFLLYICSVTRII